MEAPRLNAPAIAALRRHLRGFTLLPADPGYVLKRRVWNAAIDKWPAAIVLCADAEDVAFALQIATDHGIGVTVRGGGHNVAGRAVDDGALLLDMSALRGVSINPESRIATVQGGALWHDVDVASALQGLATTGGLISSTGVGGFTLGGGAGWLMRRHGLASDNLNAATVLLADGRMVRASLTEHADLFWGLRGAGGGLGVVTSFEFSLHPIREVLVGVVVYAASNAQSVLQAFRDYALHAPDEFCGLAVIGHATPLPFLDPEWYDRPVVVLAMCWCGEVAPGSRSMAALQNLGSPLGARFEPMSYVRWQHMHDLSATPYRFQYWKTASFGALSDGTIGALAAAAEDLPTPMTSIHLQHFGGAVARQCTDDSVFAQRETAFFVNIMGSSPWIDEFPYLRERVRRCYDRIAPQALRGLLLPNFSGLDDGDASAHMGIPAAERIGALRRRYDPAGLFATTIREDAS
jgi:FAD/FMN-containing dehydrogenase